MHGTDADTDSFRKNIQEQYDIEEELGSGQFAVVRKIVEKETGDEFAGKYVRKKRTKASRNGMSREDIKREIEILRSVDHEKIIKVHDVYETDREMILVMELLRGGELFDYISKKDFLTEEEAIDFTRQILQGLQHLHSRSIVHLDLKPENILLKNTRRKTIKLVDFGLARVVNENEQVREIMGTPEFVAPEVLNFDTISTATDMWALGVIAYILLSGASPFLGEDNQETFTNIIQVDYQFDEEYFDEISDEAKDFIQKLLVKDPRKRPTAHDCSRHTWVEEEVVDKKKRQRRRTTQICTFNFKRFVARKRWKMSFNKIRAMNLIAKMGVKPPPGFITEIPPMVQNDVTVENNVEEKSSHKEQKKSTSTINRKKHKHSSPKSNVEKTDSFTLQSMDIDIGEGEAARSVPDVAASDNEDVAQDVAQDVPEVTPPPPVETEPVDYAAMSTREKRRARGQLRHHDIVKSKKEIDAKAKTEDQTNTVEDSGDTSSEMQVEEQKVEEQVKPEPETVTSTVNVDHKPVAKSSSGGILKKREGKATRIPSTEDHYLVTLNAALFQQKEAPPVKQNSHQPSPQHSILKHNPAKASEDKPMEVSETHKDDAKVEGLGDGADSGFNVEVEVGGGTPPVTSDVSQDSNTGGADEVFEKEPKVIEETISEPSVPSTADLNGSDAVSQDTVAGKNASHERIGNKNAALVSQPKMLQQKNDNAQQEQQRFSPPTWLNRKSSNENMKPALKSLPGVSKVSLKANRFLSDDKQSSPKSHTSNTGVKATSGVLGKSKLFQKENVPEKVSQNYAKTVASKTNSAGEELKAVACDINLEEPVKSEEVSERRNSGGKASKKKDFKETDSRESKTNNVAMSKPRSGSHSKSRSGSMKNNTNGENKTDDAVNRSRSNSKQSSKEVVAKHNSISSSSSESITVAAKIPATNEKKAVVNGENTRSDVKYSKSKDLGEEVVSESAVQISVEKVEDDDDAKEELTSTSTHSLTKFTIRPRQNSGDKKTGGFDVMLTVGPPKQPQESYVSSIKSNFSSSSSSSLSEKNRVPNGNVLMSSSAIDVTNHSRETTQLTFPTGERHAPAQSPKYTPQRDFSKYLVADQIVKKPTSGTPSNPKTAPSNRPAQTITVKRSTPSISPATKGKKQTVSTMYVPRKTFGFPAKHVSEAADDAPQTTNNNDESKRWSQSSNASDRSGSSASSEESTGFSVKLENNVNADSTVGNLNSTEKIAGYANSMNSDKNHASLSPRASPGLERKWKATLVLPTDSEKPSQLAKDVRIASSNAPRKNKFTNVRSMWEGK